MRKALLFLLVNAMISNVLAMDAGFEEAVNQAKSDANRQVKNSVNQAKLFDPKTVFDNYTRNPDQSKYYGGIQQADTEKMTNDVWKSRDSEEAAVIADSVTKRPNYVLHATDKDMEHSKWLQSEAYNIVHGMTDQYLDCKPKESCTNQYQNKQCEEAPQALYQFCQKKLNVEIISHETVTHYPLIAHLSVKEHKYAGVNLNAVTGRISFLGPHDARFSLDGRLPEKIDCKTLQGRIVSTKGNAKLDYINFPSCANQLSLDYHFSNGHQLDVEMDIASKVITYEVKDQWVDDCAHIAKETSCKLQSNVCEIPGSTKIIQGIPVTRDCWQEKSQYLCRFGQGEGNCQDLKSSGCEQINSVCIENSNGQCSRYQQTYRCPIKICEPTTDVICGNGKDYCLDGSCTDHNYQASQDFAKGASAISATMDAAKQLDQSALTLFSGHPAECSEKPIGYSNCCTESGWGQDAGLDHCPTAAKELHVARDKKLAIKVGRYCSGPDPFPCIEHAQVFCVFSSKLAKIIEEQGRKGQLHLNFGSAEKPNCRGLTPEQLQAIDLSKIDFADFMDELGNRIKQPDLEKIQALIKQHVEQSSFKENAHV